MRAGPPVGLLEGLGSFGAHALGIAELRRRVAAWLESHNGLTSAPGPLEVEYESAILPADEPAWRHAYADDAYSCALRFRAALWYLGVLHPLIVCPYKTRIGLAVADVASVARHYGALIEGKQLENYEPEAADALCSGVPGGEHVSCVTEAIWEAGAGVGKQLRLVTSDGGQGSKARMEINENVYAWTPGLIRSIEPPKFSIDRPGPRRPLIWIVDFAALALAAGVLSDRS